ncbi:hypothetical protein ACO2I3_08480 [Leptospira interrogans]
MTAWTKGSKRQHYAYCWCFTRGCSAARKSIRTEALETAFDGLLNDIRPTQELLLAAHAMISSYGETRENASKGLAGTTARELQVIERKIKQLVARLVETVSRTIVNAYETQLHKLQDQKNLLAGKAASGGRPKKSFEESFRTLFGFLASAPGFYGIPGVSNNAGNCSVSCLGARQILDF